MGVEVPSQFMKTVCISRFEPVNLNYLKIPLIIMY